MRPIPVPELSTLILCQSVNRTYDVCFSPINPFPTRHPTWGNRKCGSSFVYVYIFIVSPVAFGLRQAFIIT